MKIIQITNTYEGEVLDLVTGTVPEGFEIRTLPENTREALLSRVPQADYLLASGRVKITKEVLERAGNLKMIQRTGVGLDSLDLDEIKRREIPLYVNQGVNAKSVAEHTILLMLACLRRLPQIGSDTKEGIWKKQAQGLTTRELSGRTVGLIGMGRVGQSVALFLKAFGARVLYVDQNPLSPGKEEELGTLRTDLESLFAKSDIVSLHCPLTMENRELICKETLLKMKPGVIVINTARGGLINENDLAWALSEGRVAGAGIDVYSHEPPEADHPLLASKKVICTPHIAGVTYDSFLEMMTAAMRNIHLFDEGRLDEIQKSRYL